MMKLDATLCILLSFFSPIIVKGASVECTEDGLAEFLKNPLYLTYQPTATSAIIECKAGLDLDPEYECNWSEPTEKCDDMDGKFFVLKKKKICPDSTTTQLFPHCIPESCNISEVAEGWADLLSDDDVICDGEVEILFGGISTFSTTQPSISPGDIPGEPSPTPGGPSPTSAGKVKKNCFPVFVSGILGWVLIQRL